MNLLRSVDIKADAGLEDECNSSVAILDWETKQCNFSVAIAGLGDEDDEMRGALGVVAGVVLPKQHLGADTQAIVEGGAACTELTLPR